MHLFVTILHLLLCFALVLVILLQPAKDGAAVLGGGVNSMYGPRGSGHPLGRATTVIAVLFMATSVFLAYESNERVRADSDIEEEIRRIEKEEGAALPAAPSLPEEEPAPTDLAPTDAAPAEDATVPAEDATAPVQVPTQGDAPAAP